MAIRASRRNAPPPVKFEQRLVLFKWLLSLLEVSDFEKLAEGLRSADLEGFTEENVSRYYLALTARTVQRAELGPDVLLGYDENIVRHWQRITAARNSTGDFLRPKYFQYLSLLFTEIYLDRYFRGAGALAGDLNRYVRTYNAGQHEQNQLPPYTADDLNKLAFWMATGAGKTLLMHVNILQYRHYAALHKREGSLNRIILLTPNEGLSRQHLREFELSRLEAELFVKDGGRLYTGTSIEIIDIHKLAEKSGDKTVDVESFGTGNLVLVDEGHRGASGVEWLTRRDALCEGGFSFEYSATFGQAMSARASDTLIQKYAKCILFDYSYKYFYRDGYGKDFRILNLAGDTHEETRQLYLTACLLSFYQQQKLYRDKNREFTRFLLDNPLWVFVGGSVNAVRTQSGRHVSDVLDILLFLAAFVRDSQATLNRLHLLLSGRAALLDADRRDLFAHSFTWLQKLGLSPGELYADILRVLFNASAPAALHIENLKGADGELALRLGDNEPFGVINVGDSASLWRLCDARDELTGTEREFSGSLFRGINDAGSTINILIGSKKFSEGWSSWRVSTMGLMNIGQSEGSEIIQLFGRGVRLKGHQYSLKRSRPVFGSAAPPFIELLETLQVFGVRANYMAQFRKYLEDEGVTQQDQEIFLPVINNLGTQKLKTLKLKDGIDFKRDGDKPRMSPLPESPQNMVILDWYPRIQAHMSRGVQRAQDQTIRNSGKLQARHTAFMDCRAIYFELQQFKNERNWHNFNLSLRDIQDMLSRTDWYTLYIPARELEFDSFEKVRQWQEIATALLKKYCDKIYKYRKSEYEYPFLEYQIVRPDDGNFFEEYRVQIEASQAAIIEALKQLKERIEKHDLADWSFANLEAISFAQHLYSPLLHCTGESIRISPAALNAGERDFVYDLRTWFQENPGFFEGRELYLLRNQTRGRGVGFFEAGNFHPDFIVWLLAEGRQYVSFVDPKGIRNLQGYQDPKIRFHKTIKTLEARLNEPGVVLNSFIVSNTPASAVSWWNEGMTIRDFRDHHVLFQNEDKQTYIGTLLHTTLAEEVS